MAELQIAATDGFIETTFKEMLKDRKIVVNDINDDCVEKVMFQIMKFNKEDENIEPSRRKPIKLYISSDGGNVDTGMATIDLIKQSKTPVWGIVTTYAYSMGGVLLVACHKRIAFENTTILLHDGSSQVMGSTGKMKDAIKFQDELLRRTDAVILGNTKITEEKYEAMRDREWYMFANEAKEYGVIDYIVGEDISLEEIL